MAQVVSGADILDPTRPRVYRLESRIVALQAGVDLGPMPLWGYSDPVASRFVLLSVDVVVLCNADAFGIQGHFYLYYGKGVPATRVEVQAWEPFLRLRRLTTYTPWFFSAPRTYYHWDMGVEFATGGWRFGCVGHNEGPGEADVHVSFQVAEG